MVVVSVKLANVLHYWRHLVRPMAPPPQPSPLPQQQQQKNEQRGECEARCWGWGQQILKGIICIATFSTSGWLLGCALRTRWSRWLSGGFHSKRDINNVVNAYYFAVTDLFVALDARRRMAQLHTRWCARHKARMRGFFAVGLL
jgi:hypothetical protein